MGQSQNHSEKNSILINELQEKRFDNLREYSSYKGIRSESGSFQVKGCTNEETESRLSILSRSRVHSELVEANFVWKDRGNNVFITGTFTNWKQWLSLEKVGDSFRLKTLLPREKHWFKFIVDKQWVCSTNYGSETDELGNTNNFIDLTIKKEEKLKKEVVRTNQLMPLEKSRKQLNPNQNITSSFNEVKPERSDLNTDTPIIPCSYEHCFDINDLSLQNQKGKKHYLNWETEKRLGDHKYSNCNKSMKVIPSKPHVNM